MIHMLRTLIENNRQNAGTNEKCKQSDGKI